MERRWPEAEGDVEGFSGVARHVQWAPVTGVDSEKMVVVFGGPVQNGDGARLLRKKEAAGAGTLSLPQKWGQFQAVKSGWLIEAKFICGP